MQNAGCGAGCTQVQIRCAVACGDDWAHHVKWSHVQHPPANITLQAADARDVGAGVSDIDWLSYEQILQLQERYT